MESSKMVLAVAVTLLAMVAVGNACPLVTDYEPCLQYLMGKGPMQTDCCTLMDTTDADCLCAIAMNPAPQSASRCHWSCNSVSLFLFVK
ncbi:unnamed protein product [Calypogeia fissa]